MKNVKIYDVKTSANNNYQALKSLATEYFYWNDSKFKENNKNDYVFIVNKSGKEALFTTLEKFGIQATYNAKDDVSTFTDDGTRFRVSGNYKRFVRFKIVDTVNLPDNWNWTRRLGHSETFDLWKENGKLIGELPRVDRVNDLAKIFSSKLATDVLEDCRQLLKNTPRVHLKKLRKSTIQSKSEGKTQNLLLSFSDFIKVANAQTKGKGVTKAATAFARENKQTYKDLEVVISFGKGAATAVPWIAFIGHNQKVQKGFYPVFLYYKEQGIFILSYGISEPNRPSVHWFDNDSLTAISDFFKKENLTRPFRYGDSYVFKYYWTKEQFDEPQIKQDLDELISIYHSLFDTKQEARPFAKARPFNTDNTKTSTVDEQNGFTTSNSREEKQYWWLMTNPNIWNFAELRPGKTYDYPILNKYGRKKLNASYFPMMRKGDLVVGFEGAPVKQIKVLFSVSKSLHKNASGDPIVTLLLENRLEDPVDRSEFKNESVLDYSEIVKDTHSNLLKLAEVEFNFLRNIIDGKQIELEIRQKANAPKYDIDNDLEKPFISKESFINIVSALQRKKNIILQGPPGVGKTFLSKKIAYQLIKSQDEYCIETIQFHQSYSYEDFVQGLKPNSVGEFEIQAGIFYSFCKRAMLHPEKQYVFIIDEINRGNLSKIFGDMLMIIESDKRGFEHSIRLANSEEEGDKFYVPSNVHIIGTMNSADKSVTKIDYAIQRRFAFITIKSDFGKAFYAQLISTKLSKKLVNHIISSMNDINEQIGSDPNLGSDYQLGHSYFCKFNSMQKEDVWWQEIINYELVPIFTQLWWDDPKKVAQITNQLELKP